MATTILEWFIIGGALLIGASVLIVFLNWVKSHRLRIRDPIRKEAYIKDYWVLEKKDKETGILYWKTVFWQDKINTPEPPKKSIDVGLRGRKYAEAYKLTEDEFVWIEDKGIELCKDEDGKIVAYNIEDDGKKKKIDSFNPYTATQRDVLISQHKKSDEITKKRWTAGEVIQAVSIMSMVFLFTMILIFGGDFLKDYKSARINYEQIAEKQADITHQQSLVLESLGIKVKDMDVTVSQTVPQQKDDSIKGKGENPPNE